MFSKPTEKICPLLKKPCIQHGCAWYVHVRGIDKNTGREVDEYQCTMVMQPLLMIENSAQQRSTAAAVEAFRDEMINANIQSQKTLLLAAQAVNFIEGEK